MYSNNWILSSTYPCNRRNIILETHNLEAQMRSSIFSLVPAQADVPWAFEGCFTCNLRFARVWLKFKSGLVP